MNHQSWIAIVGYIAVAGFLFGSGWIGCRFVQWRERRKWRRM